VCIVNDDLQPVPAGEVGELCLSGLQVAMGYWNDLILSEEKFCAINVEMGPFANRWYRTGDMVCKADGGNMIFKGRIDDQIKIMGFRVELGEIEQAARKMDKVDVAAAVFCKETSVGEKVINLFVSGENLVETDIRNSIEELLPKYMVPKNIIIVDEMPINSSDKIDKEALKKIIFQDLNND